MIQQNNQNKFIMEPNTINQFIERLCTDRSNAEVYITHAEKELSFKNVLFYSKGKTVEIGQPYIKSAKVTAELLGEVKGDKVRGIKFKKRKNYTRTLGHRHRYHQLKVSDIVVG